MSNARLSPSVVWWVYVMACEGGFLYVGISPDPLRRFVHHQNGKSQFSKMRHPLELLACLPIGPHRDAAREERWLKRKSQRGKLEWAGMVRQSIAWDRLVRTHGADAFIANTKPKSPRKPKDAQASSPTPVPFTQEMEFNQ